MNNKDNKTDEWVSRIAAQLREHEEPYPEGAWERYEARGRIVLIKRSLTPWMSGVAAAIVLLVGIIYLWPETQVQEVFPISTLDPQRPTQTNEKLLQPGQEGSSSVSIQSDETAQVVADPNGVTAEPNLVLSELEIQYATFAALDRDQSDLAVLSTESNSVVLAERVHSDGSSEAERIAALVSLEANTLATTVTPLSNQEEKRWDVGLMLAPSLTTEQLNLGGGLTVAYQINDRISIRSGVTIGQLGVNTDGVPSQYQRVDATLASPPQGIMGNKPNKDASLTPTYHTRFLNSQSSQLLGLDIPLDLKYAFSDKFYSSVGMSFFGVIEENRTHHYVDMINEPVSSTAGDGSKFTQYAVRTIYVDEEASTHPLSGNGYAGFLNFSVGHKTQMSRRFNLSIEPYFKLPVGRLAREDMNLTNGGIRIVTGF